MAINICTYSPLNQSIGIKPCGLFWGKFYFLETSLDQFVDLYLAHLIEQPIFRIPNILFVYFFIDFFVKHIFFEARLERVIDGAADCWSYFWSSKNLDKQNFVVSIGDSEFGNLVVRWSEQDKYIEYWWDVSYTSAGSG